MKQMKINRRQALGTMIMGGAAACLPLHACSRPQQSETPREKTRFRYCLNTSTISGGNPGILTYIDVASEAGYDGIEVWVRDVKAHLEEGNSAASLRKHIEDRGIRVENAIGFAPWMTGGSDGFKQMEEEMNLLAEIGCRRIAAPPAGVPGDVPLDLFATGLRYRELLDLGRKTGVMPQLEFWGASPSLWHLGQVLMITAVADDQDARILPDIFHLFRGGSGFNSLEMLSGSLIDIFHLNDYPAGKSREIQLDSDRVYPGDGSAPMQDIMKTLSGMGGEMVLSLELFNKDHWKQDPLEVARTGLQKMKAVVSLAG